MSHHSPPRRVIVDVDVGTDDYLTLMILFHGEKLGLLKIEAITCSSGNTNVDNVSKNVARLLELSDKKIPIYKGSANPLILPHKEVYVFHGRDGLGDLEYDKDPNMECVSIIPAAIAIHDIVSNSPNEVSLICLAPLTNIALALKLYENLSNDVKDIWLMGGNYQGIGNASCSAEYNFHFDPEAAYIVLENMKCPIYIVPLETCLSAGIDFDWRYNILGSSKNKQLALLTRAEKKIYAEVKCWNPCDAYLGAAFLFPEECISSKEKYNVTVELHGKYSRGQLIIDHYRTLIDQMSEVTIITQINLEFFKELLVNIVN